MALRSVHETISDIIVTGMKLDVYMIASRRPFYTSLRGSKRTFPTFGKPTIAVCNFMESVVEEYVRDFNTLDLEDKNVEREAKPRTDLDDETKVRNNIAK